MADFGRGVIILACPNSPKDDKTLSPAERTIRHYHFLCPVDFAGLEVRKIADGNVRLRRCPSCNLQWYSPSMTDLPKWARSVPG